MGKQPQTDRAPAGDVVTTLSGAGRRAEELERTMGSKWSSEADLVVVTGPLLMDLQRLHWHESGMVGNGSEAVVVVMSGPLPMDVQRLQRHESGSVSNGSDVPTIEDETVVDDLLLLIMRLSILTADSGRQIRNVPWADKRNYDVVYRRLIELKALDVTALKGSRLGRSAQYQIRVLHELMSNCLIDSSTFKSWIESHQSFMNKQSRTSRGDDPHRQLGQKETT